MQCHRGGGGSYTVYPYTPVGARGRGETRLVPWSRSNRGLYFCMWAGVETLAKINRAATADVTGHAFSVHLKIFRTNSTGECRTDAPDSRVEPAPRCKPSGVILPCFLSWTTGHAFAMHVGRYKRAPRHGWCRTRVGLILDLSIQSCTHAHAYSNMTRKRVTKTGV